jgi:hypothetical protein
LTETAAGSGSPTTDQPASLATPAGTEPAASSSAAPAAAGPWWKPYETTIPAGAKTWLENRKPADPGALATEAFEMRQKLSGMVKVPGANATPDEVAAWRKTLGVPESVEGYSLPEVPEGAKGIVGKIAAVAHEMNVPAPALQKVVETYMAEEKAASEQAVADLLAVQASSTENLKRAWGVDYEKKLASAKEAVRRLGGEGLVPWMEVVVAGPEGKQVRIGDIPELLVAFDRANAASAEGGMKVLFSEQQVQDKQDELAEVMSELAQVAGGYDRAKEQRLRDKALRLRQELGGPTKQVGPGAGR